MGVTIKEIRKEIKALDVDKKNTRQTLIHLKDY
jgi:hypothetical protein